MNLPRLIFQTLVSIMVICLFLSSCQPDEKTEVNSNYPDNISSINLQLDVEPILDNGDINALIEIPAGTLEKWELNKSKGQLELERINAKPRIIKYLGYPGNYGLIPQTLLAKENGGDGDPLDVLVLGPPVNRGQVVRCKLLGVLKLIDRNETDDKLIAVSANSPLYDVENLEELDREYNGILEILELWFTNYKGPNKMTSEGFGERGQAMSILEQSISVHKATKSEN